MVQKKLELARQELLDLGLRNPLLNYRTLKARGLEISREKSSEIYNILVVNKKKMTFLEAFERTRDKQLTIHSIDEEIIEEVVPQENYVDLKLQTLYTDKQLEQRLLNTYHAARTYIEEQGVNILYIAFGMLNWYEADSAKEPRKAPLILVPVQLERVSAKDRFTLSYSEEEIGHNISLIAKMKSEFALDIPELAETDEINVNLYFDSVLKSIESQKRWSIDPNSIVIGFFSFGKFLMYRDLDVNIWPENARPEQHLILGAILGDGFQEQPSRIAEDEHIDQYFQMIETNHITEVDSSQTVALLDAKQGRNMVIQGPPGTGKSQTITNLIAEAIAAGKKVLFVSEKMAALEVVKRRLDSAGLGVACLELHSQKTNKKTLLNELASTLELGKPNQNPSFDINILEETRNRINEYCDALNTEVGNSEVTPFQAIGKLVHQFISLSNNELPKINTDSMNEWTRAEFSKKETLIEELQNQLKTIGVPKKHTFWGSQKKVLMPSETEEIKKACMESKQIIRQLAVAMETYANEVNLPSARDQKSVRTFLDVLKKAISSPNLNGYQLKSDLWLTKRRELEKLHEEGQGYSKIQKKFAPLFISEAWNQDLLTARQSIVAHQGKWWKFLSGDFRKAKNKVAALYRNPKDKSISLLETIDTVMEARRLRESLETQTIGAELFPTIWKRADTDWDQLQTILPWIINLHDEINEDLIPQWTVDFLETAANKKRLAEMASDIESLTNKLNGSLQSLRVKLEYDDTLRFGEGQLADQGFDIITGVTDSWIERISELHEMASFNQLSEICKTEKLQPYVSLAQEWDVAADLLLSCFRWNWYSAIIAKAFAERPAIANFDGSRHNHAVQKFKELDQASHKFSRIRLAEAHWNLLPRHEAGGQLGVLRREFEKKSRHLPIRQLMSKAGHAIQAIKPVFMMGPLSIAAYLEPGSLEFDLVIFDEASQVKPVDAFGAIIRSKQAIVVGDSKQMPPTNFFDSLAKETDADEENNFVADMESILGLFVGQNAPQRMLRWHYRSRHESLITVSNHEFYDDKLVVFPSPDSAKMNSGLRFNHLPDSYYDRGRSRTNKLEAKTVAEAVIEHAKHHPHLTLGVAAFSMAQMQAIMDEVEVLRRREPSTEAFFSAHLYEPFFVKNLENVQGDERDVIFISIGYGKTAEGYLAMEFGPLNREGGERRLNVLITRARLRCEVFTNLKSDDIDLNRSNARGVKALKSFLKYAEKGILDIPTAAGKDFDSDFEKAVCVKLQDLGYKVEKQIGSAGFFVDLAVVDPDAPGRYLLGIECDGATYHSARSARDRDRLRQAVLEGLGWTIHRIWSTDWFKHPDRELKRVVEAIDKAKILSKTKQPKNQTKEELEISRNDSSIPQQETFVKPYQVANIKIDLDGKELHAMPRSIIASWISQVVRVESPVHVSEVMKRICDAAGIKRVGNRIQEAIEGSFQILSDVKRIGDFLWDKNMSSPEIRSRSDSNVNKKLQLISPEEIAIAIMKVVKETYGADEELIASSAFQLFGFARVTEDMKVVIRSILEDLAANHVLVKKGRMYVLAK